MQTGPNAPTITSAGPGTSTAPVTAIPVTFTPASSGPAATNFRVFAVPSGSGAPNPNSSPYLSVPATGANSYTVPDIASLLTSPTLRYDIYVYAQNSGGFSPPSSPYPLDLQVSACCGAT